MDDLETQHDDRNPAVLTRLPPPRRRTLDYFAAATRRSVREAFSRESLIASLKSLAWVAPLTILIWIYAEREQLYTSKDPVAIPVEIISSDPRQVITFVDPPGGVVRATMTGPRARVEELRELFAAPGDAAARIDLDPRSIGSGVSTISPERIESDPLLEQYGIDLSDFQPRQLKIEVDTLEDRLVDVKPPRNVTNLTGAVFEPARIKITAPKALLESLKDPLVAYADFSAVQQLLRTPGRHEKVPVRVTVPELSGPHVRLGSTTVNATFEVRQAEVSRTLDAVPVSILYPFSLNGQYIAVLTPGSESVSNITVVGPADIIQSDELVSQIKAYLEVSFDDLPVNKVRTRPLRFVLPKDVHLRPEDEQKTVDFRLERISAAEE